MKHHANVISAVFLKDFRLLWPLAALAATAILARTLIDLEQAPALVRLLLPIAAAFLSGFFLVGLVQQDAPASLSHDWLTRPVGSLDALVAKLLLATAVILLPLIIGPVLAAARDGAPVSEALLLGIAGTQTYLIVGFGLLVVTAVTATLIQTVGTIAGLALLLVLSQSLLQIFGLGEGISVLGSSWVVSGALVLVIFVGGIVVLWLQYADRRTIAARVALGVTYGLLAVTLALLSWDVDAVIAVQKGVTGHDPAADSFDVALAPGCVEAKYVDQAAVVRLADTSWRDLTHTVVFSTAAHARGLPEGWRMMIGHVQGTFVDSRGAALDRLEQPKLTSGWRIVPDGAFEARHTWTMRRDRFDDISHRATGLRLDYAVGLLEPVHTAEIVADGKRHSLPGLGACVAAANGTTTVQVSCFTVGRQPDMLTARIAGEKSQEVASSDLSFAPGLLQYSPGDHHEMTLRFVTPSAQPRVTITAYKARAYVTRSVTAPGMLGGPASSCRPAESAPTGDGASP